MPRTRTWLAGAWLIAVAACAAPVPSASPTPAASPVLDGDASVVVRLSGREVQLEGGRCTWFEGEGKLVVEVGPTSAGDYLRLVAPLAWTGDNLPPGVSSPEPVLELRLGDDEWLIGGGSLSGEMASDAGAGSFAAPVDGATVTGEFECPTVIDT